MAESRLLQPLGRPVHKAVRPPGSKSFTNRALVVASLARGVSHIHDPLDADDTVAMREGLRVLGIRIDDVDDPWLVLGSEGVLEHSGRLVDTGASGTTARFLTAVGALSEAPVTIDGTARMRERPIGPLLAALSDLGATVETRDGFPPVTVRRGGLHGGAVSVDMSISSQFMSAVLMISPVLGEPVEVEMSGSEPVSVGYLTSTIEVMEAFGAEVEVGDGWFAVAPTGYRKAHYTIEPDASAAAYPLVAAAVTGGSVVIEGMPPSSTQPDIGLVAVLERMGCRSEWAPQGLVLHGPPEGLRGVDADMTNAPDAALALAVATAFAGGPSRIRGLGTLRLKETDRLSALEAELTRMGVEARIDGDDLIVVPGPMRPARIETYDDHRMAMSFAIAGLVTPGIEILDPGCVSKTWPEFFEMLEGL